MSSGRITLLPDGILVGGETIPFLSGSCHYWRLERSRWRQILERFRDLGFPILQTYVPWSVHESSPGVFDFGKESPEKDLGAFIDLCGEYGLKVFLRPGPHINSEITYFGYPKRIFEDPENLAMSSTGGKILIPAPPKTFPAVSYASENFFKQLEIWFDAFAEVAAPRTFPDGPVIGIQPDNEMSFFFRTSAYDQDYCHWAKSAYRNWLKEKYSDPATLSAAYHCEFSNFDDIEPPTSFEAEHQKDLHLYLDWSEFKEELLHRPIARILKMLEDRGFDGLLSFHNYPINPGHTPFNISRAEEDVDINGIDLYSQKGDYAPFRKRLLCLCGISRHPVSPEFSSGAYQFWPPIDLDDQRFTTYLALAYGMRGVNFYMIVERERWYGSPISRHGEYREDYADFFRYLNDFIRKSGLFSMRRVADAAICKIRDYDRFEKAADILAPLSHLITESRFGAAERCHEGTFGFEHCIQIDHETIFNCWYENLTDSQIPFFLVDSDTQQLSRFKVLFAPTFEFMSRKAQLALSDYLNGGGILVAGPVLPEKDGKFQECRVLKSTVGENLESLEGFTGVQAANVGKGRLILVENLVAGIDEALLEHLLGILPLSPLFPVDQDLESSVFSDGKGGQMIFLINPKDDRKEAMVSVDGKIELLDMLSGERFSGDGKIRVPIAAYTVRPLEVRHAR